MHWIITALGSVIDWQDDIELLRALTRLAGAADQLAELDQDDLLPLLDALISSSLSPDDALALPALLLSLGLQQERLEALARKLRGELENIPPELRALLLPLDLLAGSPARLLSWPILASSEQSGGNSGELAFQLAGGASFLCELEAASSLPGLLTAPGEQLLRIGLDGKLQAAAAAKLPLQWGHVSAAANGAAAAELDWYHRHPGNRRLAAAVAKDLSALPAPFDLPALSKRLSSGKLAALRLQVDGRFGFLGQASLSHGLSSPAGMLAGIGLDYRLQQELAGSFVLQITAHTDQRLRLRLEHNRQASQQRDLTVGVSIDASSLANALLPGLQAHAADLSSLLEDIQPWLSPGTWLQEQLHNSLSSLSDEALWQALLATSLGYNDATSLQQALATEASRQLDRLPLAWQKPDTAAAALLGKLSEQLQLELSADMQQTLNALLSENLGKLQDGLLEQAGKLLKHPQIEQTLTALENLGIKAKSRSRKVDVRAKKLSEGLMQFLARYQQLLGKFSNALELLTQEQIQIQLTRSVANKQEQAALLDLLIDPAEPQAAAAWPALLAGRSEPIAELLLQGKPGVEVLAGQLQLSRQHSETQSGSIALLDYQLGSSSIFDTRNKLLIQADGSIALLSQGESTRRKQHWAEARELRFVNVLSLANGRNNSLKLGLTLSHADEQLEVDEVEEFFGSLEKAELIPAGTGTAAAIRLIGPGGRAAARAQAGQLEVSLQLAPASIRNLLQVAAGNRELNRNIVLQMAITAQLENVGDRIADTRHLDRLPTTLKRMGRDGELTDELLRLCQHDQKALRLHVRKTRSEWKLMGRFNMVPGQSIVTGWKEREADALRLAVQWAGAANDLADALQLMRRCYLSDDLHSRRDLAWFEKKQKLLDGYLEGWLGLRHSLFSDEIRPRAIAFMAVLSALAGLDTAPLKASLNLNKGGLWQRIALT